MSDETSNSGKANVVVVSYNTRVIHVSDNEHLMVCSGSVKNVGKRAARNVIVEAYCSDCTNQPQPL